MNIEIANRLQKLRKENGYSQEELADKLGISRQAVSKWERAESSPDTDNLIILARLYNMSLDELLYDNESDEEIRERSKDKEDAQTESEKNESTSGVHVGSKGVFISDDDGSSVRINNHGVTVVDKDGKTIRIGKHHHNCDDEVILPKKKRLILSIIDSVIVSLTLIAYLVWSCLTNMWYLSWILWVAMPVEMSLFEAIFKKQVSKFLYPVLIVFIYCLLGMQFALWHPFWFLFVTIPLFYIIANNIDRYVLKTKAVDDDEDDDEDDDKDEDEEDEKEENEDN